jgi:hypothetical protein
LRSGEIFPQSDVRGWRLCREVERDDGWARWFEPRKGFDLRERSLRLEERVAFLLDEDFKRFFGMAESLYCFLNGLIYSDYRPLAPTS